MSHFLSIANCVVIYSQAATSNLTLPAKAPQLPPPRAPTAPAPQLPVVQPPESELEDRKSKILAFRSSILDWARSTQPNTYTEFFNLKLCKTLNSALYITSVVKGQEIVEHQEAFFERLWVDAGLSADNIPFKQAGPSGLDRAAAGPLTPLPASRTRAASTQSVPTQHAASSQSSASAKLPTRISPQTPQRRTLVDGVASTGRSPADADMKRLAKDVIHALGKRKLDLVSQSSPNENPAKRQAFEVPSTSSGDHAGEPIGLTSLATSSQQVTSQTSEQAVTVIEHNVQKSVVEPSAQPIEPLAIVSAPPNTQPLDNNPLGPSNIKELSSSGSTLQSTDIDQNPPQVAGQSGSLPSEETATAPAPALPISSPLPATSITIAVPSTLKVRERVDASSSSSRAADNRTHDSVQSVVDPAPLNPPAGPQMNSRTPSSSQLLGDEQVLSLSSKSNDDTSVNARPFASDFSQVSTSAPREPLFLPSPSPSPLPLKKKKRSSVYVLVPPPPEYLIRYRKQQSMKDGSDSQKYSTPRSSVVSTSRTSRLLEGV